MIHALGLDTRVELKVRPLISGQPLGGAILSDIGAGDYRAFIEAEAPTGAPTTITLRIYVDEQVLTPTLSISRDP
ncbi:MAG: hypothetical protein HKO55_01145 [Gammaproteobacteria bacterium]|nr:hypothetical protein [Gammaproteobacteria bacterium]